MKINPISIDEAVIKYKDEIDIKSIEKYRDIYGNYNSLCKKFPEVMDGIGKKLAKNRACDGTFETIKKDRFTEYSLYSIAKYKQNVKVFREYHLDHEATLIAMGYNNKFYSGAHLHRFYELHEKGYLTLKQINHEVYEKKKLFVEKEDLSKFLDYYYNFEEAAELMNIELSTLKQYWLPKYNKDVIFMFHTEPKLCYVKKEDWNQFSKEKMKHSLMSKQKACKFLDITPEKFMQVVSDYNIQGEKFKFNIESTTYYSEKQINDLKKIQKKMLKEYEANYYNGKEAGALLGISPDDLSQKRYKEKLKVVNPPALIFSNDGRFNLRKSGYLNLYLKSDVDRLKEEMDYKKTFDTILYELVDSPINIFDKLIDFSELFFGENGMETKEYWMKYVKSKLMKTTGTDSTIRSLILIFYNAHECLVKLTLEKEIFEHTTNELKLAIFNSDHIAKNIKIEMYKFFGNLYESRIHNKKVVQFKKHELPNMYKTNKRNLEKDRYSIEEYLNLFDYVKDTVQHKSIAINDALQQIETKNRDSNHDSVWLYVLLHLNNAWRHYDVTMFPKVSLKDTRLEHLPSKSALIWLKNNCLNDSEISLLVNRVKSMSFYHSKTKKKRYFFCSDSLMSAFTHALVICQLRTQAVMPLSITIIDMDNKKRNLKEKHKREFFENMETKFDFKSKKMNRTLISVNTVLVFLTITGIKFPNDAITSITQLDKFQPFSFPSNDTNLL